MYFKLFLSIFFTNLSRLYDIILLFSSFNKSSKDFNISDAELFFLINDSLFMSMSKSFNKLIYSLIITFFKY